MPIIVDEVIISVDVTNQASGGAAPTTGDAENRQALIEECVDRVLEIIRQKEER